ncbi:hypothetical protein PUN28_016702 [Cardiocondyla obscurior]|uniref:Uncharacterized protein n=1 Tax=Cardiocondyla obscurior TaxID=286306 RepID=A0AAW2ENA2_9HYME
MTNVTSKIIAGIDKAGNRGKGSLAGSHEVASHQGRIKEGLAGRPAGKGRFISNKKAARALPCSRDVPPFLVFTCKVRQRTNILKRGAIFVAEICWRKRERERERGPRTNPHYNAYKKKKRNENTRSRAFINL